MKLYHATSLQHINFDTCRRSRDELESRRTTERARQQAEAERLVLEKRKREKEEQQRAEEERAQAIKEAALLQKQVKQCSTLIRVLED